IAVSSNLQGAATLVGDTTSIMLAAQARMNFLDFFWMDGRPGIFFAVELGALATIPIMMVLFRKDRQKVSADTHTKVEDYVPSVMMVLVVLLLIGASFIPNKPDITNGLICVTCGLITLGLEALRGNGQVVKKALKGVDLDTVLLLAGLFLVIGGVKEVGLIDDLAGIIAKVGGSNVFLLYTVVVWGSVVISAFIDNIPYVATMLPVLAGVSATLGVNANLLYFGLLTGATLGGNITPIGASANIAGVGMLRKEGHEVSFKDFVRIGIPFTLAAVTAGYVFLWCFWR
ncbi:MAG: arsenic transporter, partial [Clostridia bacterium]|nr:arsenic transporter [Clostridia bacterium]